MEDLATLRDEVYEPLGFLQPEPRPAARPGWRITPFAAPAVVAAAMAVFTLGERGEQPRVAPLAASAEVQPAQAPAEMAPPPKSAAVDNPTPAPAPTADQIEAASGVKVTRGGGASAPAPLIIDVQQALAAMKAKAAPAVER